MIAAEFESGIRNIELAVISNIRERGISITKDSFVWNYGAATGTPSEIVPARITANARTACLILLREHCEDSATTVSNTEVWDAINNCVEFLAADISVLRTAQKWN